MNRPLAALVAVLTLLAAASAHAGPVTLSGYFNDALNAALIASDGYGDLQAPRFGNDDEIARNVALYALTVDSPDTFYFDSFGYGAGGAEPFFSLFAGSGTAATFLDSNFFIPAIDFSLSALLPAGDYMLALGVWVNQSFAENSPDADPTLGDGFTALGDPSKLGNYYYELLVSSDDPDTTFDVTDAGDLPPGGGGGGTPVPEPSTLLLMLTGSGLVGLARARWRARR